VNLIGLIAATPQESRALLQQLLIWEVNRLGAFPGFCFRLGEQDCLLVESGVGLERAGEATRALLAQGPEMLIAFGVAGAAQAGLEIGDVVVARHTCQLEQGAVGPMTPLADLTDEARRTVETVLQAHAARGARLVDGVAVTTRGEQVILTRPDELQNPVLEMETYAIATAAAQAGIPLLVLRGISDNPDEPIPINPAAVLDEEYHFKIGKLLATLLRRPYILPELRRFQRNTILAAEHTALAVLAVLGEIAAG
jgi:adenosylhomocysteine nucleosidase